MAGGSRKRPNVLLITSEQQRADTIGAYGNQVCETPHLDALADAGTLFTAARCQNPYSQPSRATLLTGLYPSGHGVTSPGVDLPEDVAGQGLAALFAAAGYRTAIFGKAHFASALPMLPTGKLESVAGSALAAPDWAGPYCGFEHAELVILGHNLRLAPLMGRWNWCYGPPPLGLNYGRHLFRDGEAAGRERLRLMQPEASTARLEKAQTWVSALPEEDHVTPWAADSAISWLSGVREPFFAWISFSDPHHPMDAPPPWGDMYAPADVAENLPEVVEGDLKRKPKLHLRWAQGLGTGPLGALNPGGLNLKPAELAQLIAGYYGKVSWVDAQVGRIMEALGPRQKQTLVLYTSTNGDLLGDHRQLFSGPVHYDGLLRVPIIVSGPGVARGAEVDDPVGLIDVAPTLLQGAGLDVPAEMDGRPLTDLPREHVLTENDHRLGFQHPLRTLTGPRWKITRYQAEPDTGELYDLQEDPGEDVNLWGDPGHLKTRADLLGELDRTAPRRVRSEPQVAALS